uniref:Trimethylguanosine synthase n=1 Tax=Daphnia magna TaxID=35525 RepID=A0A0P5XR90_9CRUS
MNEQKSWKSICIFNFEFKSPSVEVWCNFTQSFLNDTQLLAQGLDHCLDNSTVGASVNVIDKVNLSTLESDWIEYWSEQGNKLVLESWIEKYINFIDTTNQKFQEENSENCPDSTHDKESSESTNHKWTNLWEEHQLEQYLYYQNWFSQWWSEQELISKIADVANEQPNSEVNEESLADEVSAAVLDFEYLTLQTNIDMEVTLLPSDAIDPNHSEKGILEKTRDFLVGFGLASNMNKTGSNISSCKVLAMKKKKKKKKSKNKKWGGPKYLEAPQFNLEDMQPNGFEIFKAARRITPNLAYFLPRNTNVDQVIELAASDGKAEIEQNILNNKVKTITAYYGELIRDSE